MRARLRWAPLTGTAMGEQVLEADSAETAPTTVRSGSTRTGSIRSVSVVSTGTVRIHPQQPNGSRLPLVVWLIGSQRWTPPRPINAYVIEHTDGLVLFDTGQDR